VKIPVCNEVPGFLVPIFGSLQSDKTTKLAEDSFFLPMEIQYPEGVKKMIPA